MLKHESLERILDQAGTTSLGELVQQLQGPLVRFAFQKKCSAAIQKRIRGVDTPAAIRYLTRE